MSHRAFVSAFVFVALASFQAVASAVTMLPNPGNLVLHLSGDTGVTLDGSNRVQQWNDLAGAAQNAYQVTAGLRPYTTTIGGRAAVQFNGAQYLDVPALGLANSNYEMLVVAQSSSPAIQFLVASSSVGHYEMHLNGASGLRSIPAGYVDVTSVSDIGVNTQYTNGQAQVFGARVAANVGRASVNGDDSTDTVTPAQSTTNPNLFLGTRAGGIYYLNGAIGEVLVYNQPLTLSKRTDALLYLNERWGISHHTPDATPTLVETGGTMNAAKNLALASNGATPFGSSAYPATAHNIPNINDGLYGNQDSWIAAPGDADPYIGVKFAQATDLAEIAFGRDNGGEAQVFTDRSLGTYDIQFTTDPNFDVLNPNASVWERIMQLTYTSSPAFPDATRYLRHMWSFDPVYGATAIRILAPNGNAIDELEVYAYVVPEPSTYALLALGGVGLCFARRRRAARG